jgi:Uri superfamily endonuclease
MNESRPIWPLKQLLCPQELAELKVIKHRYHVWKDYLNEQIAEWNARAREVHEREICSRMVATKQGVPKDFGSSHTLENLMEKSL